MTDPRVNGHARLKPSASLFCEKSSHQSPRSVKQNPANKAKKLVRCARPTKFAAALRNPSNVIMKAMIVRLNIRTVTRVLVTFRAISVVGCGVNLICAQLAGTAKSVMKPSTAAMTAIPARWAVDLLTLIATRHCNM